VSSPRDEEKIVFEFDFEIEVLPALLASPTIYGFLVGFTKF